MNLRILTAILTVLLPLAAGPAPSHAQSGLQGVRQIVNDRTPLSAVNDQQLLQNYRFLARMNASGQLPEPLKARSLARMRQLQIELSRRVAERKAQAAQQQGAHTREGEEARRNEQPRVQIQPVPVPLPGTRPKVKSPLAVLNDKRPPSSLNRAQLRRRLKKLELIIDSKGMPKAYKRQAMAMRARDRAELVRRQNAGGNNLGGNGNTGGGVVVVPDNRLAVLKDRRAPSQLSDAQLLRRLARLERIIDGRGIAKRYKRKARAMRAQDQRELDFRRSAGTGGQGGYGPVTTPGNKLTRVLYDNRPPATLNDAQLLRRLARLERLIDAHGVSRHLKRRALAMRAEDQAEYDRRRRGKWQDPAARRDLRLARSIINDTRPADQLSTAELRNRTNDIRRLLSRQQVRPAMQQALRQRLVVYRSELRARVAAARRRNGTGGYVPQPLQPPVVQATRAQRIARNLLRDRRSSRQLEDRQLRQRVANARLVLRRIQLTPYQRRTITRMIRNDRNELRRRLLAARDYRRKRLNLQARRGTLTLDPYLNAPVRPGDVIPEAESRQAEIGGQLISPPGRIPGRRYTLDEVRRNPRLTRHIGGIDLDTINFGTNEYWVREEEAYKLERIGTVLERILAVRPYEIFQIEGHTDSVGSDAYNLELSRKRATAVARALTEFFNIPAENLVTVGLGERYLKIPVEGPEVENRRVSVRRITPIVQWER